MNAVVNNTAMNVTVNIYKAYRLLQSELAPIRTGVNVGENIVLEEGEKSILPYLIYWGGRCYGEKALPQMFRP